MRGLVAVVLVGCVGGAQWTETGDTANPVDTLAIRYTWTTPDFGGTVRLAGDLTGDGVKDAVRIGPTRTVSVIPGPLDRDLDVGAVEIPIGDAATVTLAGDVDGDGVDDLWLRRAGVYSTSLVRGPITAASVDEPGPTLNPGEVIYPAFSADFDGDGAPDLVAAMLDETTGVFTRVAVWAAPFGPAELATPLVEVLDCDQDPLDYGTWGASAFSTNTLTGTPGMSIRGGGSTYGCEEYLLDGAARGTIDPAVGDPALTAAYHAPQPYFDVDGDGIPEFLEPMAPNRVDGLFKGPRTVTAAGDVSSVPLASMIGSWAEGIDLARSVPVDYRGDGERWLTRVEPIAWGDPNNQLEVLASSALDLAEAQPRIVETFRPPFLGQLTLGDAADVDGDGREELFVGSAQGVLLVGRP